MFITLTKSLNQKQPRADKFFNFWLHGAFLNISGGKKMAKSSDNFLTLERAVLQHSINPLAYRFLACQVHYRKPMEYSLSSFQQADGSLLKLQTQVSSYFDSSAQKTGLCQFRVSNISLLRPSIMI
jgi:cysteinyl-tRNA synthetase